jgi:hypothetical protein
LTGPDLDGDGGRPSRDEVTPSSLRQLARYILKIVNNAELAISSGMSLLKCYKCTESVSCCRQYEHMVTERLETHSDNDPMSVKVVRCSAMKPSNCNVVMDANSDFGRRAHIGMLRNAAYLVGQEYRAVAQAHSGLLANSPGHLMYYALRTSCLRKPDVQTWTHLTASGILARKKCALASRCRLPTMPAKSI